MLKIGSAFTRLNVRRAALVVGFLLVPIVFWAAAASAQVQNPQSGAAGLTGRVPASPPLQAPTITSPTAGQSFTQSPVVVVGSCQNDLLVKLYRNGIFSGSALCASGGYSITTDLFPGSNDLFVRQLDALDQASPDSNAITVSYSPVESPGAAKLTLTTSYARRGADPDAVLDWPFSISGGTQPYAISIDWGDGASPDLISATRTGEFKPTHTYSTPGNYVIIIKVTDQKKDVAFLQLVSVINGTAPNPESTKTLVYVDRFPFWMILIMLGAAAGSYWLGRRSMRYRIRKRFESGNYEI